MIISTPPVDVEEAAALARIGVVHKHLRHHVSEPKRWLGPLRRILSARAIQGSNTIEGYDVSVEDAIAAIEGGEAPASDDDDWQAVVGYRRALTYVLQLAQDAHFAYSAQLIRSLHYLMTEHFITEASPGLWRPGPTWVSNDVTGEVVYEGPESAQVPTLVDELVGGLAETNGIPVMIRAAMAHLNLVMIHPFRDGNGRMSRCLQTLVLAREGILAPELSSIEEYLGRNTSAYYEILGRTGRGDWNPAADARPWVRFCLQAHYIQARSVLRRVEESMLIWDRCAELAAEHRLQTRTVGPMFDATLGLSIRNATYRTAIKRAWGDEISKQVATDDLAAMVKAGFLTSHGTKRGTHYTSGEPLRNLYRDVRKNRKPITVAELFTPMTDSDEATEPPLPF